MPAMKTLLSNAARRTLRSSPSGLRVALQHSGSWIVRECAALDAGPIASAISPEQLLPQRPLPLPMGVSEAELRRVFSTWAIDGEPEGHMDAYVGDSFGRFVHTYGLVAGLEGTCLELGANPYFTTHLIDRHTDLEMSFANYFETDDAETTQTLTYRSTDGTLTTRHFDSKLFNIEDDEFPYEGDSFDVVLYCEIIEHLLMDPVHVLRKIRRILKDDGVLVLTTPNVARLNNILRLSSGDNIYDPYSGYGPYGRHNREYTMAELHALLGFLGFAIEESFIADSHPDFYEGNRMYPALAPTLTGREQEVGQYLFVRARIAGPAREGLPDLLYRSYPPGEVVPI